MKVTVLDAATDLKTYIASQSDLKVAVLTDFLSFTKDKLFELNNACRAQSTALISTTQVGLFGSVFNDFGQEFVVLDKDGEEL